MAEGVHQRQFLVLITYSFNRAGKIPLETTGRYALAHRRM